MWLNSTGFIRTVSKHTPHLHNQSHGQSHLHHADPVLRPRLFYSLFCTVGVEHLEFCSTCTMATKGRSLLGVHVHGCVHVGSVRQQGTRPVHDNTTCV